MTFCLKGQHVNDLVAIQRPCSYTFERLIKGFRQSDESEMNLSWTQDNEEEHVPMRSHDMLGSLRPQLARHTTFEEVSEALQPLRALRLPQKLQGCPLIIPTAME